MTEPTQGVFSGESSDSAGFTKPTESYQVRSDLIDAASLMKRQLSHGQSQMVSRFYNNPGV